MYILTAEQVRKWDEYTMEHEPIAPAELMERAAQTCFNWLSYNGYLSRSFSVFCGKGNNGGDGLALARMLMQQDCPVNIYILEFGNLGTPEFQLNLSRLHELDAGIRFISSAETIPVIDQRDIIIDALFGTGLNRPLVDLSAEVVQHINAASAEIITIDIPSGLPADEPAPSEAVIHARHTLSFQCFKPAFLFAEHAQYTGNVHVLDIGLHPGYLSTIQLNYTVLQHDSMLGLLKPRPPFAHKGTFGHALLIAGSYGKFGAAVLAARACLHSGVGLITVYAPACGYSILQTAVPEAMVITDTQEKQISTLPENPENWSAIGIGPGLGTSSASAAVVSDLVQKRLTNMVIDADALNCISRQQNLLHQLGGNILTPHPKEFDRLFGASANGFERMMKASAMAKKYQVVVVLKGRYTLVACRDGSMRINMTGNPGMATGGTGDVLTGIITALRAQGYSAEDAASLSVYLHGLAGDLAAEASSEESLSASQLIHFIGMAFRKLKASNV